MTTTIRNVQVAQDPWNDNTDPKIRAWKEMSDYRISRDAVIKAGQTKSPALPLSLLMAVHKAGMRVDQVASATGVAPATVSLALRRNGLTDKIGRRGQTVLRQCSAAAPLAIALKVMPIEMPPTTRRAAVLKGVPAEERARLRDEFYAVSERLRKMGLTFEHVAILSGRAIQSVHQWRVRKDGNYPAPPQDVIDDLKRAAERHEAVLARARALLEIVS
ncbi:hypothetical protein LB521_22920 [Mesorhizobium sp. BR-1-1-8]|uniref:hypothetical protein n=1 Tax=Mesorhizobium sp. BR-1-1-8 TaxID=2876659 RepID=UPI001CCDD60F|nr:hypothetical protein [Mesorhizobium sp. BR-1-1-8]MBZ9983991.1 hypothetical protein [Mesorhizobium sp. BR-1-1-8]